MEESEVLSDDRLPAPGDVIGEFKITKPLGVGGCGAVFQAFQERLDREVAVKLLLPNATQQMAGLARRFLREIDLVKRLEHPNIVRLYDFGESDTGLLWMAMELVRGPELATVMAQESRFDPERAQSIILQTLSGLAEAHSMTIVHRDMKPGNIMLTQKGADTDVVKLLDFGIGKALGEHEDASIQNLTGSHGDSFGTPRYMAPELLMKEGIGPHSDVYSAGLILYEMIVGEPAVIGESIYEILARQLSSPLQLPDWLGDTHLGEVIRRATEKDWKLRYSTAFEFHQALKEVDLRRSSPVVMTDLAKTEPVLEQAYKLPEPARNDITQPASPSTVAPQQQPSPTVPDAAAGAPAMAPGPMPIPSGPLPPGPVPSGPLPPGPLPSGPLSSGPLQTNPGQVVASSGTPDADDDDVPTEGELKSMLSNRAARRKQKIIISVVVGFLFVMMAAWILLSGGDEEESSEDEPVAAETKETEAPTKPPPQSNKEMVPWAIKSTPTGVPVQVNGRHVCDHTPCVVDIQKQSRPITVYFATEGYLAVSKTIIPDGPGEVEATLREIPKPEPAENADVVDAPAP